MLIPACEALHRAELAYLIIIQIAKLAIGANFFAIFELQVDEFLCDVIGLA